MCVLDNDDPIIIKFTVDDIHNTLYFSINDTQFPLDKGPEGTLEIISPISLDATEECRG